MVKLIQELNSIERMWQADSTVPSLFSEYSCYHMVNPSQVQPALESLSKVTDAARRMFSLLGVIAFTTAAIALSFAATLAHPGLIMPVAALVGLGILGLIITLDCITQTGTINYIDRTIREFSDAILQYETVGTTYTGKGATSIDQRTRWSSNFEYARSSSNYLMMLPDFLRKDLPDTSVRASQMEFYKAT